jgi:hypothetical protein
MQTLPDVQNLEKYGFVTGKKRRKSRRDLASKVFGRLTVLEDSGRSTRYGSVIWLCRCSCGKETLVVAVNLLKGITKSCGCLARDYCKTGDKRRIHGHASTHREEGYATREYLTWCGMKGRCCNPDNQDYKYYGGRGITVYQPWIHSFETFLQYLKDNNMCPKPKGLSIDRIKNNGNYEPGNIRWATQKEQVNNQRRTGNLVGKRFERLIVVEDSGKRNKWGSYIVEMFLLLW